MKKETEDAKQKRNFDKVNKRAQETFQRLNRKNRIQQLCLLLVMMFFLGLFAIRLLPGNYQSYAEKNQKYTTQIEQLELEKAAILSGEKEAATGNFKETLDKNLANLKDYPEKNDLYTVEIRNTNASIRLNRNNLFVSDNANMLNKETKKKIYDLNKQLAASTNGAQLQVVTVPALPSGESIESYAEKIFNQLGIGNKDEDNGVLYLIALGDQEFRLEVGYGLEGLITDSTADDIISDDDVVEAFEDKKYDAAVSQVVDDVFNIMNSKTALVDSQIAAITRTKRNNQLLYWLQIIILSIGILLLAGFLISSLRGRKLMKQYYQEFQTDLETFQRGRSTQEKAARIIKIKKTSFYYLMMAGIGTIWSAGQVKNAVKRGRILAKYPKAKKQSLGRILVGDTLYGYNGDVITTAYLASHYNPSNHSDSGSSGSSGGGSWGSFGGGSSGGGGASGGW
ncbi:TPM domain-containing protein [Candidatus Enterococcus ferrettii]|uniref:TPM domain-containing protein n=1 Tax=Candidatus Enterococcus ferrettii TaxID=2815324 RepID=A0ABV0EIR3_9ENTE|nr:TPM domain-containing protein [Enterococcus sp. 665A]MBO1342941.1 TPM domain-containing protein [Enterococcus sp. 665A]